MLIASAATLPFVLNAGFGQVPRGSALTTVESSPNYRDGQFHNPLPTPGFTGDVNMLQLWWDFIHMMPEEAAQAAVDLNARAILPGHSGRFVLARHSWNDPWQRLAKASEGKEYRLLTPQLGEPVSLTGRAQLFSAWWEPSPNQ